jgi:hypothetical protein
MNTRHTLVLSVLCLTTQILFAQQKDSSLQKANTPTKMIQSTKPHYLSISFDLTAGMSSDGRWKNPKGVSFGYIISAAKRYKPSQYYFGFLFNMAGKSLETSYTAAGIKNGKINWSYSTLSLGLTQRYFFKSTSNTIPFVDLDLGWRTASNWVDSEYDQYSKFLGYYHSGDDIYENHASAFSVGLGVGLYFQVIGLNGPFIKLGLTTGNKAEVMMPNNKGTGYTNSTFITMSFGLML